MAFAVEILDFGIWNLIYYFSINIDMHISKYLRKLQIYFDYFPECFYAPILLNPGHSLRWLLLLLYSICFERNSFWIPTFIFYYANVFFLSFYASSSQKFLFLLSCNKYCLTATMHILSVICCSANGLWPLYRCPVFDAQPLHFYSF